MSFEAASACIMRYLTWRFYLISAFITNFVIALVMWSYLDSRCQCYDVQRRFGKPSFTLNEIHHNHKNESIANNSSDAELSQKFMVLMRNFEFFENDVTETVKSVVKAFPLVKILILTDGVPYPPLHVFKELPDANVHMLSLKPLPNKPSTDLCLDNIIDREHVLIIPDAVRIGKQQVMNMLKLHVQKPYHIIASPLAGENVQCLSLNVSLRHWTLKYKENTNGRVCDALSGTYVLLVTKSLLTRFSHPFARPFPQSLHVQSSLLNVKVEVMNNVSFAKGKSLFTDPHVKWKFDSMESLRKQMFYQEMGIKKVLLPASRVEWYGCNKNTPRCFGTVHNDMPEYLFQGRWTPPCCLENLRQTARYVFSILEKCSVRYWLEGGSLLGAARNGDIIPWDFDVDIGIYRDDIPKCEWLKNSLKQSIVDNQGFVWEKAREGDFIRVQYSQSNHLHVDIFPFYSKNGIMTKDTWFVNHRQDMEFPEHFLLPLKKIKFVGVLASAPNNHREFLELKFGSGAIETPKYPVPEALVYSKSYL